MRELAAAMAWLSFAVAFRHAPFVCVDFDRRSRVYGYSVATVTK